MDLYPDGSKEESTQGDVSAGGRPDRENTRESKQRQEAGKQSARYIIAGWIA